MDERFPFTITGIAPDVCLGDFVYADEDGIVRRCVTQNGEDDHHLRQPVNQPHGSAITVTASGPPQMTREETEHMLALPVEEQDQWLLSWMRRHGVEVEE